MDLRLESMRALPAEEKIRSFSDMPSLIAKLKRAGISVMLAQGVFDIPHRGHVGYLRAARQLDVDNGLVIIGIENDESVRRNKGTARPINSAKDRMQMLAEFISSGLVFTFDDAPEYTNPQSYIQRYRALNPTGIVVPTWDPHRKLKQWQAEQANTQLAMVKYKHYNSTTAMLKKLGYKE